MHQSELALFAQSFERALAPLAEALRAARDALGARASGLELPFAAGELAAQLATLAGELQDLRARVAGERASVFVLGPPKAGKSTLLDALAAAPVAEVSMLPGYPCVRSTHHAAEESAVLTRFDGSSESLPDPAALALVVQRALAELAAGVRAVHARGEPFEAGRHLPQALRRIEHALPVPALARAALELIECPPVPGALFASHQALLIGEPDRARAAVFVVRAAQLCDPAVFDGLEELLAAFERMVLVLNVDGSSRELARAGALVPGPEREDPARLVSAFEELTAPAPLAQAIRAGRITVLAIDLLAAAHARLAGAEDVPASGARRSRLADLERELAGVLDVHEALHALARSGLRRARELVAEARALADTPGLTELEPRRAAAELERTALERAVAALARAGAREPDLWAAEELFDGLRARLRDELAARAGALAHELALPLAQAVEDWFTNDASLAELMRTELEPRVERARQELARAGERALRAALAGASETALSAAARADLAEARVPLAALLAPCAEAVPAAGPPLALRVLDASAVPVRARLGQRLAFRAEADVRSALLGPPAAPERALTADEKARRLGGEARAMLQRSATERASAALAEEARARAQRLAEGALARFLEELRGRAAGEDARAAEPVRRLSERAGELDALAAALHALGPACAHAEGALADAGERFEQAGVLVPAARIEHACLEVVEGEPLEL